MKRFISIVASAIVLMGAFACQKVEPDNQATLESISLLKADNPVLTADVTGTIGISTITFVIPKSVTETMFVPTFTCSQDDKLLQGETVISSGASKISVTTGASLTIKDDVSNCSKSYTIEVAYDDATAALVSISFAAADNSALTEDVAPEAIADNMLVRVPGAAFMTNLVISATATENDVISINGHELEGGKATVDTSFPIDIEVNDPVSKSSKSYVLKVGKILEFKSSLLTSYVEEGCGLPGFASMAIDANGTPYVAYTRKRTAEPVDSYNQVSVVKWNGSSMQAVGPLSFTGAGADKAAYLPVVNFDSKNNVYVAWVDNKNSACPTVHKFNGSAWELFGGSAAGTKANTSYEPCFIFDGNDNPIVITQGNTTNVTKRMMVVDEYEGGKWNESIMKDSPVVNGTDGVYIRARGVKVGSDVYVLASMSGTTANGGYYLFKKSAGSWSLVSKNFVTLQHISSLALAADKDGNLYAAAAVKGTDTYGLNLYKISKTDGSFTQMGTSAAITGGGSTDSIYYALAISPVTGEMIIVYRGDKSEGAEKSTAYMRLFNSETGNWDDASVLCENCNDNQIYAQYTKDGKPYICLINSTTSAVELYTAGLEADIIPE